MTPYFCTIDGRVDLIWCCHHDAFESCLAIRDSLVQRAALSRSEFDVEVLSRAAEQQNSRAAEQQNS
jgi:hypothetical protein